jgi:Meiotically Up-regulated Gene 113 (MUG113) protein
MNRSEIVEEIRRTAASNNGRPLGLRRFSAVTGIRQSEWEGKLWARWSDAVQEAGFRPNSLVQPLALEALAARLATVIRELGHYPTSRELRLQAHKTQAFPATRTLARLGRTRGEVVGSVRKYCESHAGFEDVLSVLASEGPSPDSVAKAAPPPENESGAAVGYVYLIRSGRYYKIGRSNSVGRRAYELAIQLPDKPNLIHAIKTDDPPGIEMYWHRRFEARRRNGEWFALSQEEIRAFKRRQFM